MQRYDINGQHMWEASKGEFVRYQDAQAEIARLTAALDKVSDDLMRADMLRITAEAELTALRAENEALRQQIAAAEAEALERAATACDDDVPDWAKAVGQKGPGNFMADIIRALITPEATTALDAVKAEAGRAGYLRGLREAWLAARSVLCSRDWTDTDGDVFCDAIGGAILALADRAEKGGA